MPVSRVENLTGHYNSVWLIVPSFIAAQVLAPAMAGLVIGIATLPRAVMMILLDGVVADRLTLVAS